MSENYRYRCEQSQRTSQKTRFLTVHSTQFFRVIDFLQDKVVDLRIAVTKFQTKVWTASINAWKNSALYRLLNSTFLGAKKSQTKVWKPSANISKDSLPYSQSFSTLHCKWIFVRSVCWSGNRCQNITDESLNNLGQCLKSLHSLKSIHLNFYE